MKRLLYSAVLIHLMAIVTVACTCGQISSPYQAYDEAQAVFIGKVISSHDVPYDETVRDPKYNVYDRYFKFEVAEILKGAKANEIVINVGRTDSSCYRGFSTGETYLIYAYKTNQRFNLSESFWGRATRKPDEIMFVGACTRSTALKYAGDDVRYLRGMLRGVNELALDRCIDMITNQTIQKPAESLI